MEEKKGSALGAAIAVLAVVCAFGLGGFGLFLLIVGLSTPRGDWGGLNSLVEFIGTICLLIAGLLAWGGVKLLKRQT